MKWLTAIFLTVTMATGTTTKVPAIVEPIEKVDMMGPEDKLDVATRRAYISYMAATDPKDKKAILRDYTRSVAKIKYGWNDTQYAMIDEIWTQESQWNPRAHNKKSGAWGIAQMLTKTQPKNPFKQIHLGLKYINHKYDAPEAAKAHKDKFGWY